MVLDEQAGQAARGIDGSLFTQGARWARCDALAAVATGSEARFVRGQLSRSDDFSQEKERALARQYQAVVAAHETEPRPLCPITLADGCRIDTRASGTMGDLFDEMGQFGQFFTQDLVIVAPIGIVSDPQRPWRLETGRIVVQGKGDDRACPLKQHRGVTTQVAVTCRPLHTSVVPLF